MSLDCVLVTSHIVSGVIECGGLVFVDATMLEYNFVEAVAVEQVCFTSMLVSLQTCKDMGSELRIIHLVEKGIVSNCQRKETCT